MSYKRQLDTIIELLKDIHQHLQDEVKRQKDIEKTRQIEIRERFKALEELRKERENIMQAYGGLQE